MILLKQIISRLVNPVGKRHLLLPPIPMTSSQLLHTTPPRHKNRPSSFAGSKSQLKTKNKRLIQETQRAQEPSPLEFVSQSLAEDALQLEDDHEYESIVSSFIRFSRESKNQRVVLIQPYIKWGPRKSTTHPDLLVEESESLVHSLPNWTVLATLRVPLESLDKKLLFGTGKLEELKAAVAEQTGVTCIFISKSTLSITQKQLLEKEFRLPILDRYSIVVQILRNHATTTEAKLQVAMAELPYIWTQMRETSSQGHLVLSDTQKELLRRRERKIKQALKEVRSHRELLRKKRTARKFPVIAVVGYTNAGKTSIIKALTNETALTPRNQLFATLDVTAHAGLLPSNMQVIYMDTVGFMADLPTGLIECFVATLEDAILADLIVHVVDLSHPNYENQRRHVEGTLKSLYEAHYAQGSALGGGGGGGGRRGGGGEDSDSDDDGEPKTFEEAFHDRIINVGNKIDKIAHDEEKAINGGPDALLLVSSKTKAGCLELTEQIQRKVLEVTNCREMTFSVPMGGQAAAWLYKNSTVVGAEADEEDCQVLVVKSIILDEMYFKFRHMFQIEGSGR